MCVTKSWSRTVCTLFSFIFCPFHSVDYCFVIMDTIYYVLLAVIAFFVLNVSLIHLYTCSSAFQGRLRCTSCERHQEYLWNIYLLPVSHHVVVLVPVVMGIRKLGRFSNPKSQRKTLRVIEEIYKLNLPKLGRLPRPQPDPGNLRQRP